MIKRSAGIGTILLIGLVVQTAAQLLPVENFNVNSGLSQSQVTSITQDIRNYLWIGTAAGLNRFDGVHFTTFSKKDGINSNSITALYCSHKGDIWIGTTKGLSKYDGYRFENLQTPEENQFVSFDAIAEDASGNIYAYSSWQGIFIVKGGKVMRMNTPEKNKTPTCIYSNSKNQLWVYINGAGFYTLLNERWTKKPDISGLQKHEFIRQMVEGKDSYYAITNQRDLLKIRDGQVVQRKKNTGFFLNACVDDGTNLWVASSKGIIVLDGNDLSFKKEINARNGLSDNLIHTIYKDADNNFWIGADGDGLFKYCGGPFVRYDKNTGLAGNIVMGFSKTADGNILLGTREGGLQLFDYQKKTFRSIHYRSHSTYGINCMGSDGRGTVYIGTMDNRLLKINGEQVSELSLEKKYRPGIYTIKSYGHRILVHTTMGGYWIDGATVTKMQGVTGLVNSIELNAEEILMAGDNGIYAYSLRKNNFKKLYIQGIADDINISCFARLNNYIVIGSFGEGLFFWDPVANRVLSCNRDDGLKDNNVFALMKDTAGNLWVGTSSGMQLVRLDDQQKSFYVKQFNIGDGYEPSETNLNAMLEDSEHNVWVGTTKGVFIYHSFPEKEHSLRPPVVVLESVDYPGFKTATQGSFSAWEHLPVDPQIAFANNSISFNFKGICLRDPAS